MRSALNSTVSRKISASGLKEMSVPVALDLPMTSSFLVTFPWANSMWYTLLSLETSTSNHSETALTHLAPTPWVPPENLYPPWPYLPPEWRVVSTSSTVGIFFTGCGSTGMPRPSSWIEIEPSTWMVTSIREQCPARCSSTELSSTSETQWCSARSSVPPMYMPGFFRTASKPSRVLILEPS